jgi:hypothetical protein
VEIVTFSRVLGCEHDSGVNPVQVGLEGVNSRRASGTDVRPGVCSGVAAMISRVSSNDLEKSRLDDLLQKEVFKVELLLSRSLLHSIERSDEIRSLRPTRTSAAK